MPGIILLYLGALHLYLVPHCTWGSSAENANNQNVNFSWEFTEAPRLPGATVAHSATVLQNGSILVVGGYGKLFGRLPMATTLARIYNPKYNTWRVLKTSLWIGRLGHAAIRMPDGKVLIVGGRGQNSQPLYSIELFDPNSEQFQAIASLRYGRIRPRLNFLDDYRVLITGYHRMPEIFQHDPKSRTGFISRLLKQSSRNSHSNHSTFNLPDGTILLAGGGPGYFERFDPETETFTVCQAKLPVAIDDQAAGRLFNGVILLAGGQDIRQNESISQSWLYDPKSDQLQSGPAFTAKMRNKPKSEPVVLGGVSDMQAVDLFAGDSRLRGRYIFLCGGEYDAGNGENQEDIVLDCAWVYDAVNQRLVDVGPMLHPHDEFALAPLPAGPDQAKVLIIGGHGVHDTFQSHCEIFTLTLKGNGS
jgi:galactose oxidase-like protein